VQAQRADAPVKRNPLREAYFGDLHLHTSYSLDAYLVGSTKVDPDEAYRFAKGEMVRYLGAPVQRREALDFMAVTDHSELMGVANTLDDPNSAFSKSNVGKALRNDELGGWEGLGRWPSHAKPIAGVNTKALSQSAWQREMDAANRNNQPGKFTTFIAYEWTAEIGGDNLHRNVIFEGSSAPNPFTSVDSNKPEDLWVWLERIHSDGFEALAIPHNPNASNGLMYDWVDSSGKAIDRAYAQRRQAHEPLSEISQTKGTSETHPLLSPTDEFADFEIFDFRSYGRGYESPPAGSYLRDALGRGLVLQEKLGINPFKYGFVGGSDLHSGLSVSAQADYKGTVWNDNIGAGTASKAEAVRALSEVGQFTDPAPLRTTSGNLTGIWAESNTRRSLYEALRRRETFATTGTRLKIRFYGGWKIDRYIFEGNEWPRQAYATAVPMGADLPTRPETAKAPSFVVWAIKDPDGANLDRLQIVKVWEKDGRQHEDIYDAAWSGQRRPDPRTGSLPAVGNTVDLKTGAYQNSIGATELKAVWVDRSFDVVCAAAYYVRVLEIPTPRWATLLAIKNELPLSTDAPTTVQQRGWSSPIWYAPRGP